MLKLRKTTFQKAADALDEVQRSYRRYNTRSHKKIKVIEINGIILIDMTRSVGTIIKTEAIKKGKISKKYLVN